MTTPKASEKIIKKQAFDHFVLWLSLPPDLRGLSKDKVREQLQIEDELIEDLLSIRYKKDFAQRYQLSLDTLTDWGKKIEADGLLEKTRRVWLKSLTGNVVKALYRAALIEGDAPRAKLYLQYVEGWVPKEGLEAEVEVKGLADLVQKAREVNGAKARTE